MELKYFFEKGQRHQTFNPIKLKGGVIWKKENEGCYWLLFLSQ